LTRVNDKVELAFEARSLEEERFWAEATHADALYALEDSAGSRLLNEALAKAPAPWMAEAAQQQHNRLKTVLDVMRRVTAGEP
jgi:hypothetical protein